MEQLGGGLRVLAQVVGVKLLQTLKATVTTDSVCELFSFDLRSARLSVPPDLPET